MKYVPFFAVSMPSAKYFPMIQTQMFFAVVDGAPWICGARPAGLPGRKYP